MEQTSKYGFSQWDAEDRILMEDFNADNAKIEAALAQEASARAAADANLQNSMNAALAAAGNCKIAAGSYVGTGTTGSSNPNSLTFNFYPLVVFLDISTAADYNGTPQHYILFRPATRGTAKESGYLVITWNETGVSWHSSLNSGAGKYQFNTANQTYHYLAIGV